MPPLETGRTPVRLLTPRLPVTSELPRLIAPLNRVPAAVLLTGRAWLREVAARLVVVAEVSREVEALTKPEVQAFQLPPWNILWTEEVE